MNAMENKLHLEHYKSLNPANDIQINSTNQMSYLI